MDTNVPRRVLAQVVAAAAAVAVPALVLAGLGLLRGRGIRVTVGAVARVDVDQAAVFADAGATARPAQAIRGSPAA